MMSSQQRTSCPPSSHLPAFALRSPHHPGGPATPELPHTHTTALTQTHHAASVNISFTQPAEDRDGCKCFYKETHKDMTRLPSGIISPARPGFGRVQMSSQDRFSTQRVNSNQREQGGLLAFLLLLLLLWAE